MRRIRVLTIILVLCLALRAPAGAVDSLISARGSLQGKTFLVLGDSITAGYGLISKEQDWSYVMARARSMTQLNYSLSGSTVAAGFRGLFPMVERCMELPEDAQPDFVLLQGGSNDYSKGIPLGDADSRDPETFRGALTRILDTLQEKYPQAVIIGVTPWGSDDTKNREDQVMQDYTDAMMELLTGRGCLCFNAGDPELSTMYVTDRSFRRQFYLSDTDWYHLNAAGHARFAPVFAQWLENTLYGASYSDQFYDLAAAEPALQSAVAELSGVLYGTSDHLFSPTKAATRAALALSLYRMAGRPSASNYPLMDVEADTELYTAVCWAMDQGVVSPADWFEPDQTVTREMLATMLYRYYTEFQDKYVSTFAGLGSYPDGREVSEYARLTLGWAMQSQVLTPLEGMLRPQSAVSRGQLALALQALRRQP